MISALLCLLTLHDWQREWFYHNPLMQGDGYPICERCTRCRKTQNMVIAENGEMP